MTSPHSGSRTTAASAWFSRVGLPLADADVAAIRAMLADEAERVRADIRGVAHWHEVGEVIRAVDWDSAAWDREEEERQRLWHCATERLDESAVLRELSLLTDALAAAVQGAAAGAAERDRVADPGLVRAASGAVLMAAHQSALARLAGEDAAHFFVRRFAVFERGRWPLGLYRGQYIVF